MKTVTTLAFLTLVEVFSAPARAYILPLDTVITKAVEQNGTAIISVEQNVVFKDQGQEYIVYEKWLIEGDKNLKLTAKGIGPLKDLVNIHYIYNSKKRTEVSGKNRVSKDVSTEFFERLLAIKTVDSFRNHLKENGISQNIRLSRAAGSVSFAIGDASTAELRTPQIWIDQNLFHMNKVRFLTAADVEFTDYKDYGKETNSFQYPNTKIVNWDGSKTAEIHVLQVQIKSDASIKNFYPDTLDIPSEITLTEKGEVGKKIEDFYKRFR